MAPSEFEQRIKTLSDAVDKRAAEQQSATDATPVETGEEPSEAKPAGDVKPLVDVLGVDEEVAGLMLECAKRFDWLKGMSPEELAKHLSENVDDMQMIMLEVARKQDDAEEYSAKPKEDAESVSGTAAI